MTYHLIAALKDGRTCVVRNAVEEDAQAVLDIAKLTHEQYLMAYSDETERDIGDER